MSHYTCFCLQTIWQAINIPDSQSCHRELILPKLKSDFLLTTTERSELYKLRVIEQLSISEIGRRLKRNKSTISR
ncbi:helix-turn-helix domain-containing protein [Pseudanabaena sp. ABRG5-3]|uniref:helix-turn-helix domain-containing protein n=1 Tax=Pseudanabaena sp. ABRG5-3 TaxID=685565 RepID=UPI0013A621C5